MNREIIFRGKKIDTKEWVYGNLVMVCNGETLKRYPCIVISYNHDAFDWHEVIPETVGQYTGVNDKNKDKIFEGDIIHYKEFQNIGIGDMTEEERCLFSLDELKGEKYVDRNTDVNWHECSFLIKSGSKEEYDDEDDYDCAIDILASNHYNQSPIVESMVIGNIYDNPELL